ncbi:hypothetical protein K491DRAFT_393977 [Lophiostoma macrostomum CBS 122681]|uniref:Uncharacterized protein n=1 Tax=Lophiostoma macrostomum CBS 122681 TaxID=1314788 RepID=A0A6A6TAH4_9PLEO|nr:hypothetical protein K491DRAFT_393977 [Lophiostoma macrostomum CBS 122681]
MLSYPIDELVVSNLTRILTFGHHDDIKKTIKVQDCLEVPRTLSIKPKDSTTVSPVLQDLASLGLDFSSSTDQTTRRHLLDQACAVWSNLETPWNTSNGHSWIQPALLLAMSEGTERGIWTYLASLDEPFGVSGVSHAIGIDRRVLSRLMRHLAATGYLRETEPEVYIRTNSIKAMARI